MAPLPLRVLVVRLSALGDVLSTLPAFELLRRSLPGSDFAWAVESPFLPLLDALPGLGKVIPFRTKAWRRAPFAAETLSALARTRRELRDFRADLAIDFQGTLKSAVVTRFSGARLRIGLGGDDLRETGAIPFYNRRAPAPPDSPRPVVLRGLALAAHALGQVDPALGSHDPAPGRFAGNVPRDPEGTVERFVGAAGRPIVLLQPGAGWGNKEWGAERFGALASRLAARGLDPVVAWGPGEEALAADTVAASGGAARQAPKTSIAEMAALAGRSAAVVGGDTGPVHLAAALGVPTVAMLGPTASPTHAPWGPAVRVVEMPLACRPCNRRYRGRKPCLDQISVEAVTDAVVQLVP